MIPPDDDVVDDELPDEPGGEELDGGRRGRAREGQNGQPPVWLDEAKDAKQGLQSGRALNDCGVFRPPVLLELFQLSERGEIGHSIEEELALQVVNLVLDADGIEARSVQLDGLAVPIEVFHPHPDRTSHLAAEPINAETSLPALSGHRREAHYLRVDQDGPRETVLPLVLHDHDLCRT